MKSPYCVHVLRILNQLTNCHEIFFESYGNGVYPNLLLFSFLKPVEVTWRTIKRVKWERSCT